MTHPYLNHLLEDIKNAHRKNKNFDSLSQPKTFEEEMEQLERWISGEFEHPLSYFTGLKKDCFPPSNQFSEKEMHAVLEAFHKMMESWNASIDFPEEMPTQKRYEFLINHVLENEFTPIGHGQIHMDFCSGEPEGCDWETYCSCLRFYEED